MCGVNRFGHIISGVPPLIRKFATARDDVVISTFAAIQQEPPPPDSTHSLLVGAGGASLASLFHRASSSYLGAFFRVASPMQQRLTIIAGRTSRKVEAMIVDPDAYSPS